MADGFPAGRVRRGDNAETSETGMMQRPRSLLSSNKSLVSTREVLEERQESVDTHSSQVCRVHNIRRPGKSGVLGNAKNESR